MTKKSNLPANLAVAFTNQTGEHTGTILENCGITWKVQDEAGDIYQVRKTSCREADPVPASTDPTSLAGQLSAAANPPAPKVKKEKGADKDPDLVTLAELCAELKIVGRIARRRLRKSLGKVGAGARWEWRKASEELAKVRTILTATAKDADGDDEDRVNADAE